MLCAARGVLGVACVVAAKANTPPVTRATNATILEFWMNRFTKIPSCFENWRRLLAVASGFRCPQKRHFGAGRSRGEYRKSRGGQIDRFGCPRFADIHGGAEGDGTVADA
jgi:hypothetical protein